MNRLTVRLMAIALALSPLAATVAAADYKDEVKVEKKALKDDKKDYKQLDRIIDKWQRARVKGKSAAERKADEKLAAWITAEIAEDKEAAREARQEFLAAGGDQRSLQQQRVHPAHRGNRDRVRVPAGAADELRRAEVAKNELQQTRELARELRAIQPRFDSGQAGPQLYQRKAELLDTLLQAAARDVKRSTRSLARVERGG